MEDADADALLGGYVRELDPVAETTNDDAADDADDADDDAATTAAPAAAPPNDDADLDPGSDSEEWEPLERDPSTAPSARAPTPPDADAAMTPGDRVDAKLLDLLSRTSSACFSDGGENARFTAVSTSSSSASSVWDDPTTTTACVELIETLARASARPRRRACRLLPLRTLRDRWATRGPPGERDRETRDALPRVLAALGFRSRRRGEAAAARSWSWSRSDDDASSPGGAEDVDAALDLLSTACASLGGVGLGAAAAAAAAVKTRGASPHEVGFSSPARALWSHVHAHLGVVAETFESIAEAVTVRKANDDARVAAAAATAKDPRWRMNSAACAVVVAFYVSHAGGNARVGESLLETGALRAACACFVASGVASSPHAEALRRLLLLAAAAAPEAARWIVAVPGARAAVETDDAFLDGGALAAHGALWELVLPAPGASATDAERVAAGRMARALDAATPATAVAALRVLRATQRAAKSRGGGDGLWRKGGAFDAALRAAQTALASALAAASRARDVEGAIGGRARKTSGSDDDDASDDESDDESDADAAVEAGAIVAAAAAAMADGGGGGGGDTDGEAAKRLEERSASAREGFNPELEKDREAAAAALRALKEILGAADGGGGTRKCD
jgi:hypothetical protein